LRANLRKKAKDNQPQTIEEKPLVNSLVFTSKYHNHIKETNIKRLLHTASNIKNQLSQYIYDHRQLLLSSSGIKELKENYKTAASNILLACNIQKEHHLLVDLYANSLKKHMQNLDIKLQDKIIIQYYSKDTKYHKKGDIKLFKLTYRSTKLTRLTKYLIYLDHTKDLKDQLKHNEVIYSLYEYYESKGLIDRIIKLAYSKQQRLLSKLKLIQFKKYSSLILDYNINKARIDYMQDNKFYQYWFVFRMRKDGIEYRLPLQHNNSYHENKKLIAREFYINLSPKNNSKINIATTCEADKPTFKSFNKVVGMDLNLKNNFAKLSDGCTLDYDRDYMQNTVKALKELDKIGYQNLTNGQLQRLKKIHRQLEWYVSLLIHKLIQYLNSQNITDIVIEELLLSGKFGINEEFDIKYVRLSKLLHLSKVKDLLKRQAEKHGIRVHITQSHYTSQTCPKCGHISRDNRKTQESFKCVNCGYESNADLAASQNIELRYTSDVLRSKLHNIDEYGRLVPKKLNRYQIKAILNSYYASLPTAAPRCGQDTERADGNFVKPDEEG
jgi:transposase